MKSFILEFLHVYKGPGIPILMAGIVLLSILAGITIHGPVNSGGGSQVTYDAYFQNNSLIFQSYAYDAQGSPAPSSVYGGHLQLQIAEDLSFNNTYYYGQNQNLTDYQNVTLKYGISGWSNTTLTIDPSIAYYYINIQYYSGYSVYGQIGYLPSNYTSGYPTQFQMIPVISPANSSRSDMMVFYLGNSTQEKSPPVTLYVQKGPQKPIIVENGTLNTSDMLKIKTMSGFNVKRIVLTDYINGSLRNTSLGYFLVNANGRVISETYFGPIVNPSLEQPSVDQSVSGVASVFGLLIPFLAVFAGYISYAGPRSLGTLESTIVRRVNRTDPLVARYAADAIAIASALAVATALIYFLAKRAYGVAPGLSFIEETFGGYLVAGLAFLGIVYLIAHTIKSNTNVLLTSIFFFVIFGLFWSIFPPIIAGSVFKLPYGTPAYVKAYIDGYYFSPGTIAQLIFVYDTKSFSAFGITSLNTNYYGVFPVLIILDSLIWVIVPIILAYFLAARRD